MGNSSIRLGLMPPLTGVVGMYGEEIVRAAQIACQEVNDEGGIHGIPLQLVVEDDGSLPESAVAAANRLVTAHRCVALIGNLLSNSRIAVAYQIAEPRRIPYLNFSFYEGSILSRYFFHFAALPNQQIERMIPAMRERFGPRMFFAGNNYEWPRGSIDAAKTALAAVGGQTVGEEYLPIGVRRESIEALLDQVEAASPDVFVPYFAGEDQLLLLNRFTERGLKSRIAVVMGHFDEVMASRLPAAVRAGFYSSNTYFMGIDSAENRAFLEHLAAWPQGDGLLTNFGEGTYLCVKAFAQAARRSGGNNTEALVEALATVELIGPQGSVRMDPITHHARINSYLARCTADGRFEIVERFGAIDPVLPERYRHLRITATSDEDIRLQARMLEQISEAVLLVRTDDASIVYANPGAERMYGYEHGELTGLPITRLVGEAGEAGQLGQLARKGVWSGEALQRKKNESRFWVHASVSAFTHPVWGEVWLAVYKDVDAQYRAQKALEHRVEEINQLMQVVPALVMVADNRECQSIVGNLRAKETYELADRDNFSASQAMEPRRFFSATGRKLETHELPLQVAAATNQDVSDTELHVELPSGRKVVLLGSASPLRDQQGMSRGAIAAFVDISDRKKAEADLEFQATHDPLTGLANRILLTDRIEQSIIHAQRFERSVAVMLLDLDRFKCVNDSLGHQVGDVILQKVAAAMVAVVRPGDTVARLGGDEFVVVMADIAAEQDVMALAHKVLDTIALPVETAGRALMTTASAGIAFFPRDGQSTSELIRNADLAMYRAKELGRTGFQFYAPEMNAELIQQFELESALRHALAGNELELHYQPKIDLQQGHVIGAEALVRWRHPTLGLVSPADFIPLAEETGLIVPIGQWVIENACAQIKSWQAQGLNKVLVSVNVSARQLSQPHFVDVVAQALRAHGLATSSLEVEITETTIMTEPEAALEILEALKALGIHISLDDFGIGYSSLGRLDRLPVDALKIDQSFIRDITTAPADAAIAQLTISLGHALGMKVLAEGVETEAQMALLKRLHCDQMQGYLFSHPLPATEFAHLLKTGRRLPLPDVPPDMRRTLLIVDEEPYVIAALNRLLRPERYHILSAVNADEAMDLLARHPVQVVLSDQRMANNDGVEFLSRVSRMYPQTARILLTGYTNIDSVATAINRGAIFRFLFKPWDDDQLRNHVRDAFLFQESLHIPPMCQDCIPRTRADREANAGSAVNQAHRYTR